MQAVALSLLGWHPDAEDVVQDAILVALARLGDLRDPAAAGPWLRAITRNAARMRLRSSGRETALGPPADDLPAREPTSEAVLDDHALRDSVHGRFRATLTAATVPGLHLIGPQGQRTRGREALADIMDSDLDAGVRQRLNQITAGNRITILECDLLSPRGTRSTAPQPYCG